MSCKDFLKKLDSQCFIFRYIVVETNYRIYAYTDSNLQIALLGLFTEILYRYNRKISHFAVHI